ncbi:hypothetical protein [Rhodococcus sp. 14-2470-1a]|uniref:hypothetical protein n=1 Tax=Rhodococcus sp. 14-2470-1a TaxID=2023150 RepID=UPI000B9ADDA7|nr:hypothetical protein [Rhodococcus sp. 14-2470-1a]OZF52084.1 hypothetical protein CH292_10595 [Rhodococcus sp. 14-2470-1a]
MSDSAEGVRPSVNEMFRTALELDGWEVMAGSRSRGYSCSRNDETLHFVALGKWELLQSEVDTLYGRVLRAITRGVDADQLVIVLPEPAREYAPQVSSEVRQALGIEIAILHESGRIEWIDGDGLRWFSAVNLDALQQIGHDVRDGARRFGEIFKRR